MTSSTDPYASIPSDSAAAAQSSSDEALQQTTRQALDLISDSLNTAKEQACKMWDDMRPQLDKVANYAKDEPTKAVLMAVAAGALIVTVVMASNRSSKRIDVAASKKWLRAFAADSADRAKEAARDTAEQARDAAARAEGPARSKLREMAATAADEAKSMTDTAVESAKRVATQAYEDVSGRLTDLRGKADPLLEQIQPQLDNVAGYAKKNPLSALIVATAAGALLSRLTK